MSQGRRKHSPDSRTHGIGLQLADVLAGSVARSLTAQKQGKTDPFVSLISETTLNFPAFGTIPRTQDDWPRTPADYEPPADALEFTGQFYVKTGPS